MVVEAPPDGDEWLHEIKHDGYRIVARVEEGDVRLVSRNGKDWTKEFPQVARAVARLPAGTALLDGEVAAVLPSGATSFQALQRRADAAAPLVYFAFDLLHLDGWDLREVRLEARKEVLRRLLEWAPDTLRFSDHVRGRGPEFFEKARQAGLEGVVSKRADAPYREGRGGDWRKAKCRLSQEMVIGGWTLPSDGRASIGALHVGFYEDGQLVYAGKVGSGFSERLLADLLAAAGGAAAGHVPVRPRPRRAAARRPLGRARTSWPRSSSRSGPTRAGCASRCSSGCARTATRATSCASGRGRSRAAASTRWRPAGRGRRCASTPRARAPRAATRSSTSSACA